MKEACKGTAKCDKKCSGAGKVEVGGCSFVLQVKKGAGKISKCACDAAQPTIGPVTGSGSGPEPPTGSGSGPSPPIGSGSGEQPVPLPGSGSGPQPPAGGESMQCGCKCDCPQGTGECDCDCNCPMNSQAVNCAPGFSKVCPMMGDQCPEYMEQVCPSMPTTMPLPAGRMMGAGDRGCQCVPDFLLSLVMGAMTPAGRSAAVDRAMTKVTFKIGKTTCKCQYEINPKDCKRSKMACDKKCNGKISGLELEDGNYVMSLMVKKGKVAIQKCEAKTTEPTGTGGGPGSGPGNGGGSGMGSGPGSGMGGGMGGMGTRCACVSMGGGPMPPTGSGSGPMPPTGSGPNPPTGTGSGSGPEPPTGSGSGNTPAPPPGPTIANPGSAASTTTFKIKQTWSQEADYDRTAEVSIPATSAGEKVPVVIHLHGNGGQGNTNVLGSWLGDIAVIVSATGYERSWNVVKEKSKADDVSFILDLIAKVGAEIPAADMNNVAILGTSNGAALTYRLMIETGKDRPFRKVFPMVSSLVSAQYRDGQFWKSTTSAAPGEPNVYDAAVVPEFADDFIYMHFHGTEDGLIKYEGQSPGPALLGPVDVIAAQETDFLFAKAMGYTGSKLPDSSGVSVGLTSDKQVEEYSYLDGRAKHYKLVGEGHGTGPSHDKVREVVKAALLA